MAKAKILPPLAPRRKRRKAPKKRKKFSGPARERWLQILQTSVRYDATGELVPQYAATSQLAGAPCVATLRNWWRARDIDDDDDREVVRVAALEVVRAEGAEDWLRRSWIAWRELVDRALAPAASEGLDADKLSRAALQTRKALDGVAADLQGRQSAADDRADRLDMVRARLGRSGLLRAVGDE